jgi:hypothetical protein
MTDDDIKRLRDIAQAATPGPWQWDGNVCDYDESNESPWLVTDAYAAGIYKHLNGGAILKGSIKCLNEADAAYIAAASPAALLGLLDRLAAAERERDEAAAGFVIVAQQLADVLDIIAETFNPPEPLASRFVAARAEVRARLAEVKEGQA